MVRHCLRICSLKNVPAMRTSEQGAPKNAPTSLETLERQVGDAASLTVDAADRHDKERQGKRQTVNDNSYPSAAPPLRCQLSLPVFLPAQIPLFDLHSG